MLDRDGFPKAHEVFDGNAQDRATVGRMLQALERRSGQRAATVIVDRGMAYRENLEEIRRHGYHYIVAGRQPERNAWWDALASEEGWQEVMRPPSPGNCFQAKSRVAIERAQHGEKECTRKLHGSCVQKTDRDDLPSDGIWRSCILLTRVEDAFRDIKSPLRERPIFHRLQHRVQTHIFLCVLAYHLLVSIEHCFLQQDVHTSWATVRDCLRTHQVVTVVLPTESGAVSRIRQATMPEPVHREIYETLAVPLQVMKPVKTWTRADES